MRVGLSRIRWPVGRVGVGQSHPIRHPLRPGGRRSRVGAREAEHDGWHGSGARSGARRPGRGRGLRVVGVGLGLTRPSYRYPVRSGAPRGPSRTPLSLHGGHPSWRSSSGAGITAAGITVALLRERRSLTDVTARRRTGHTAHPAGIAGHVLRMGVHVTGKFAPSRLPVATREARARRASGYNGRSRSHMRYVCKSRRRRRIRRLWVPLGYPNRRVARREQKTRRLPPAGFEPATYGLEVRCSIQLSYRGLAAQLSCCAALST